MVQKTVPVEIRVSDDSAASFVDVDVAPFGVVLLLVRTAADWRCCHRHRCLQRPAFWLHAIPSRVDRLVQLSQETPTECPGARRSLGSSIAALFCAACGRSHLHLHLQMVREPTNFNWHSFLNRALPIPAPLENSRSCDKLRLLFFPTG